MIRPYLLLCILPLCLPAQQLQVKSATAHKIELSWTGSAPAWIVERLAASGKFEKLADSSTPGFADEKIDPVGIYQYRVRAGENGQPSNAVTAGAPPTGILKGAAAPKGADGTRYGMNSALAFDENGDPALAWLWFDPNGDGDSSDTAVYFVHWDRAKYQWRTPVKVAVVGNVTNQNVEPVSLGFDVRTGAAALSYPIEGHDGFTLAQSKDAGMTWELAAVTAGWEGTVTSTSLALAAGRIFLAANSESPASVTSSRSFPPMCPNGRVSRPLYCLERNIRPTPMCPSFSMQRASR